MCTITWEVWEVLLVAINDSKYYTAYIFKINTEYVSILKREAISFVDILAASC
jgi:hypothetical protein